MIIGKYDKDYLTGLEFITFPEMRFVINRVLKTYLIEFDSYGVDSENNIYRVYMDQELYEGICSDEENIDMDCQLWLRYNLPHYEEVERKVLSNDVYVPYN